MVGVRIFNLSIRSLLMLILLIAALVWCAPATSAQDPAGTAAATEEKDPAGETAATGPTLKDYKGVTIGMSAD